MPHSLRGKTILITGGTGFIGTHLTQTLAPHNRLYLVGRHRPPGPIPGRFVCSDVRHRAFTKLLARHSFDYIFHLAGNADQALALRAPQYDLEANFFSTFHLLESLRRLKKKPKLILASSVTVYGHCPDARLSEKTSVPLPFSNYGVSKLAAERYVYAYAHQYQIPALTLRFFSTYGPGMRRLMIYDFMKKLSAQPGYLEILGTGTEARDLTYIDDQIKNIKRVAERADYRGEVYNLGSGRAYTTRQIAALVARAMGVNPRFSFTGQARVFDAPRWVADVRGIKRLGCTVPTTIARGIARTVRWYQSL